MTTTAIVGTLADVTFGKGADNGVTLTAWDYLGMAFAAFARVY